ncbi:hypothetical protein CYMTET_55175 [Cymbomonas tetramitiformis]|uniref:E3 ubiquitin-protein ligase CHFR n=1 Tax=Cymbomonas tetramitiformis TaxID=36881 RepID=A0AAE0EQ14_9CHLO|nr:hypothetical protein CYMTET_55175 [Cymbomonas tetramitiformis]|eukprot:gene118-170_t
MSVYEPEISSHAYIEQILSATVDNEEPLIFQIGEIFNTGRKSVRVGRHPANDVVLNYSDNERIPLLLDRFHAFIECKVIDGDPVYTLGDKRSTNGTYCGPDMIPSGERKRIHHGMIISFGGPMNVQRNDTVNRNPFRFVFFERAPEHAEPTGSRSSAQLPPLQPVQAPRVEEDHAADAGERVWTLQEAEDLVYCPICTETCVDAHLLSCGHSFCGGCIFLWCDRKAENSTCPVCRKAITEEPVQNDTLEHVVELTIVPKMSPTQRRDRNTRKQECLRVRQARAGRAKPRHRAARNPHGIHRVAEALTTFLASGQSMESINGDTLTLSRSSTPSFGEARRVVTAESTSARGNTNSYTIIRRQSPCILYSLTYRQCATCMDIIDKRSRPMCFTEQSGRDIYPVWYHFDCYAFANPDWTGQGVQISRELSEADKLRVENRFATRRQNLSEVPPPTLPVAES